MKLQDQMLSEINDSVQFLFVEAEKVDQMEDWGKLESFEPREGHSEGGRGVCMLGRVIGSSSSV